MRIHLRSAPGAVNGVRLHAPHACMMISYIKLLLKLLEVLAQHDSINRLPVVLGLSHVHPLYPALVVPTDIPPKSRHRRLYGNLAVKSLLNQVGGQICRWEGRLSNGTLLLLPALGCSQALQL